MTPGQRVLRARIAAYASHRDRDGAARTAPARAGFLGKFAKEIRALHPELDEAEVQRRAAIDLRLHMARLAFQASRKASKVPGALASTGDQEEDERAPAHHR